MANKSQILAPPSEEDLKKSKILAPPTEEDEKEFGSSLGQKVLSGVMTGLKAMDSVTGAPTRAAIHAAAAKDDWGPTPWEAFKDQFGNMKKEAPDQSQTARDIGFPDRKLSENEKIALRSPLNYTLLGLGLQKIFPNAGKAINKAIDEATVADVAGIPVGMAADWTLPGMWVGKGASKGIMAAAKLAEPLALKAEQMAVNAAAKTGEAITGVPANATARWMVDKQGAKNVLKAGGGNLAEASDVLKEKFMKDIQLAKSKYAKEVEKAISDSNSKVTIKLDDIVHYLEIRRDQLTPNLDLGARDQIDNIISNIKSGTFPGAPKQLVPSGPKANPNQLSLSAPGFGNFLADPEYLNAVKVYLQNVGKRSYTKSGQIFVNAPQASNAAKGAATIARKTLNKIVPAVESPNNALSEMHIIEDTMNRRMIAPGQSEAALIAAGAGQNPRNAKALGRLSELVEGAGVARSDMVGDAERLAAAKYFNDPQALPVDTTGKSILRSLVAGGAGALLGEALGIPAHIAGPIVATFSSPMMLKAGIEAGRVPITLIKKLGITGIKSVADLTPTQYATIVSASKTAEGMKIIGEFYQQQIKDQESLIKQTEENAIKRRLQKPKQ